MSKNNTQRALVFQGGGALGAYEAGVFQALYEVLPKKDERNGKKERELFDIIAGTSSGAMNGAILVSHVIQKGTWNGAADTLNNFWNYVSRDQFGGKIGIITEGEQFLPSFDYWWEKWHSINPRIASEEAARRYYSTKQFLFTGVPHVFSPLIPRQDERFLDNFGMPNNMWYIYNNQPLKQSVEGFVQFPIKTEEHYDKNHKPRLLLVSVDVQEGSTVTFDSYPKHDGKWKSEYGNYFKKDKDDNKGWYEYTITYDGGITANHVMASCSVPINYDYANINVDKLKAIDNQGNPTFERLTHYFWDGGLASNTPLRELIQSHKDYWINVKGEGKEDAEVPDLDVFIVDMWPSKEENIAMDHDSAIDRKIDLLLNDKTDYDETVANIVSDYIQLFKKTREVALNYIRGQNEKKAFQTDLDKFLTNENTKSVHRTGQVRQYKDLINGRFDINVMRIERSNDTDDISNKLFDYSTDTIDQLIGHGYDDALRRLSTL